MRISLAVIKPATTLDEQIRLLKSRGLQVLDEASATNILRHVQYYRLSGYMLSFKDGPDKFREGTCFETIYQVYEFDRKLRNLLMRLLESIEISLRSAVSYHLAHAYGAIGYQRAEHFENAQRHDDFLNRLESLIQDARTGGELFIVHHDAQYGGQLPIWVAIEVLRFGPLSKLIANLTQRDREQVSYQYYGVPEYYFVKWVKSLSYLRNVCAHYSRLYNRKLKHIPRVFKKDRKMMSGSFVFDFLYVAGLLCPSDPEWGSFVASLDALVEEYSDVIALGEIGFPVCWRAFLGDHLNTLRRDANVRKQEDLRQ